MHNTKTWKTYLAPYPSPYKVTMRTPYKILHRNWLNQLRLTVSMRIPLNTWNRETTKDYLVLHGKMVTVINWAKYYEFVHFRHLIGKLCNEEYDLDLSGLVEISIYYSGNSETRSVWFRDRRYNTEQDKKIQFILQWIWFLSRWILLKSLNPNDCQIVESQSGLLKVTRPQQR